MCVKSDSNDLHLETATTKLVQTRGRRSLTDLQHQDYDRVIIEAHGFELGGWETGPQALVFSTESALWRTL